jgi:hypothetical protein
MQKCEFPLFEIKGITIEASTLNVIIWIDAFNPIISEDRIVQRLKVIYIEVNFTLEQWFPTGVPRHTTVPQRGVRGAVKIRITAFYYTRCRQIVILTN